MDSIVVQVSELKRLAGALVRDKMDYVRLMLLDEDAVEGMPPAAAIVGLSMRKPFELVDYDALEGVPAMDYDFQSVT